MALQVLKKKDNTFLESSAEKTNTFQRDENQTKSMQIEKCKKRHKQYIFSTGSLFQFEVPLISLASPNFHRQAFCPPLYAISSCHATSYLLGPQGHCLSDWQGFDAAQYSNNPRACRSRRITAWWDPAVETAGESEWRGRRGGRGSKPIQAFHLFSFLHVKITDNRSPIFLLFLPSSMFIRNY